MYGLMPMLGAKQIAGTGPATDGLLLETGDYGLLETGNFILLE
jgi:hypothetical protein